MYSFETINAIVLPKGENKKPAEQWLTDNGVTIPEKPARCLHSSSWKFGP